MILIDYLDGHYMPVVICDICEQRIRDAQRGGALYRLLAGPGPELLPILHVHKGECFAAGERRLGGAPVTAWQELRHHLLYVTSNCGLTPEKLAAEQAFIDRIGFCP